MRTNIYIMKASIILYVYIRTELITFELFVLLLTQLQQLICKYIHIY